MNYTEYAEIVDTVETPDGMTFRALIVQDDDAHEPYFYAGCPIIRIEGYRVEMTSYGAGQDDGLSRGADEVFSYFRDQLGSMEAIDTFERYLHIYHDGNITEHSSDGVTYVAYVTRTLWESWGNTGEVGKADLDEWRAYVEGDTYGVMVEVKPTVDVDDDDGRTDPYSGDVSHDGWTETDGTCWGFYGQSYAEESARDELAAEVASHNARDAEATLFQP